MDAYDISAWATEKTSGWQLGSRFAPRRFTIRIEKLVWFANADGRVLGVVTPREFAAMKSDRMETRDQHRMVGGQEWIELDVASTPDTPPRCVELRAPYGIGTPELRIPLAGLVAEATAALASRDGTFTDMPSGLDYEDARFEADRAQKQKKTRRPVDDKRLREVAEVAREHPRKPTAAVQHRFGYSRGYARRLIKQAQALGLDG